ncbi:MAG: LemA family protein [Candidatus Micrarchaeia archaeon]
MDILLILVVVVLFLGVAFIWSTYNRFITLKERIDNAWAQIDVQLKRRYDLIPNLIETVKGYAKHEKTTLEELTKQRAGLVKGTPSQKAEADALLGSALGRIFAVAENYPQLKANENFLKLQEELSGTEDKISYVRTAYNDYVYQYNRAVQLFPSNILAGIFHFMQVDYFKTEKMEKEPVKVKF